MKIIRFTGAFAVLALMANVVQSEEPPSLESSADLFLRAQIDTAREVERELEHALGEVRSQRSELEHGRQGRSAGEVVDLDEDTRIVNGIPTIAFPSVGALLKGNSSATATSWCTGTLIGCRFLLTANHCVAANRKPADYQVFFQNFGFVGVEWISPQHPDYAFPHADLALLRLAKPVEGVPITAINRSLAVPSDTEGALVGFGRTGGLHEDYGIKRMGTVKTAACDRSEKSLLCWDFNAPVRIPGSGSNTCNADSGGPLLVREAGGAAKRVLAGVTSGGSRTDCLAGDHSYDVDVKQFAPWIDEKGGAGIGETACGSRLLVDSGRVKVVGKGSTLSVGEFQDYHFSVPAGIERVVVTMNSTDTPRTNFGLFVKRGALATAAANDCAQDGSGNYGACQFAGPAQGDWYVRIDQQGAGKGEFQVVVTMFPKINGN